MLSVVDKTNIYFEGKYSLTFPHFVGRFSLTFLQSVGKSGYTSPHSESNYLDSIL